MLLCEFTAEAQRRKGRQGYLCEKWHGDGGPPCRVRRYAP